MKTQTPRRNIDVTTADGIAELEMLVQCRLAGQIHDFQMITVDGRVILRGQARTYHDRRYAEQVVREAAAIPMLINEIEVS